MSAELARLIAGYVCLHSGMAGVRMAAPLLALTLGYGNAAVGVLVALVALPQVFIALPAGRWADRHGVKVPVRCAVVVAMLGAATTALWPVYPVLCVSAFLVGGSMAVAAIALQRHVGRAVESPTQLKHVFSWLSLAPAFANFVGPFAAGLVIDNLGYRAAFMLLTFLPPAGWMWVRTARELPREHNGHLQSGTAWNLWREPRFRHLLLMNWFMSASWDVHSFVVPVLGHERGLPASAIGSIMGSFAIAAAAVRVAMPIVSARLHESMLITGAMAATALLFGVYPFTRSPITMGLCSALIGVAVGSIQPMIMSLLHQITPRNRHGEAVAMRFLMINASSVAMPLLFGAIGGFVGVSALFWVMAVIVGLGTRLGAGLRGIGDGSDH